MQDIDPALTETAAFWKARAAGLLLDGIVFQKQRLGKATEQPTIHDFINDTNKVTVRDYCSLNCQIVGAWCRLYLDAEHKGLNQERFLWMGAAGFASSQVREVILKSYDIVHDYEFGRPRKAGAEDATFNRKKIVALGTTNAAVFNDLYWQHLAYESGGIRLLEHINFISKGSDLSDQVLQAWKLISEGEKSNPPDVGKIREGNLKLLLHEQEHVVQKFAFDNVQAQVYNRYFDRYGKSPLPSPVPAGRPFKHVHARISR